MNHDREENHDGRGNRGFAVSRAVQQTQRMSRVLAQEDLNASTEIAAPPKVPKKKRDSSDWSAGRSQE